MKYGTYIIGYHCFVYLDRSCSYSECIGNYYLYPLPLPLVFWTFICPELLLLWLS